MGRLVDDSELALFDLIASEVNELYGDEVNYYATDNPSAKVDPLYGEPIERSINGPFRLPAYVSWPQYSPESGESGFGREFDGTVTISRIHLDRAHAPYPGEGDVIEMWRTPYHDARSMGVGMFMDVVKSENSGHINDTASFVQFKLYVKRRTQYGAERKVFP